MDGETYRIAGVMPASFDFPLQTDVYRALTDYNAPHVRRYSAVARLAPRQMYRANSTHAIATFRVDPPYSRYGDSAPPALASDDRQRGGSGPQLHH